MNKKIKYCLTAFKNGLIDQNPTFVQVLGLCPTLATTTSVPNAIGMGLAATFVLTCSNALISLLRRFIPKQVRIAAYIVVIAGFVSIVEMLIKAYLPALDKSLGVFIPLIVVNCIILARAEAFASKNTILPSIFDGIGTGLGFTLALTIISTVRETLGNGTFCDIPVFGDGFKPVRMLIMPYGAFITLGIIIAAVTKIRSLMPKKAAVSVVGDDEPAEAEEKSRDEASKADEVFEVKETVIPQEADVKDEISGEKADEEPESSDKAEKTEPDKTDGTQAVIPEDGENAVKTIESDSKPAAQDEKTESSAEAPEADKSVSVDEKPSSDGGKSKKNRKGGKKKRNNGGGQSPSDGGNSVRKESSEAPAEEEKASDPAESSESSGEKDVSGTEIKEEENKDKDGEK